MNTKKILCIIIIFCIYIHAQVNNLKTDSVYSLPPVVVSARAENSILNIPYSIDVFGKEEIQQGNRGLSLNEILDQVPGLIINNRNNLSMGDKISIRGIGSRASFGVRGIKIIYDGIPLTFADGQSELTNIDFQSMGKIEVLRGPASSIYGNSAGGVINIETEKPSAKIISSNPSFTFGSFGLQNYNVNVSGTLNNFAYLFNFNKFFYDGFRQHSSSRSLSINSILSYDISDKLKIRTILNYFNAPYLLNPSSLSKEDALKNPELVRSIIFSQGAGEKTWEGNYGITADYIFNDNFSNTTTIYFIKRSLLNPIPGRIIDLNRSAGGIRTLFEKKFSDEYPKININGGFDFEFQNDLRKEFENNGLSNVNINAEDIFDNLQYGNNLLNQKEYVTGIAPFIQADIRTNEKLEFQFGSRFDNNKFQVRTQNNMATDNGDRNMNSFNPMIGIIYHLTPLVKLYANFSTSFQTPTTNELSNNPSGAAGFNPELQPEKTKNYEIGTWGILPKLNLNFEASFFIMNFSDMLISYQSEAAGSEEIFYRNAGKAQNIGSEIKLDWSPVSEAKVILSYTKLHFTFKDYLTGFTNNSGVYDYKQLEGNYIPGVPPNYFSTSFNYSAPFNFSTNIELEWTDKYFTNDFNGPIPGSLSPIENYLNDTYLNVDAGISYKLKVDYFELNIFGGINNIFNKRYNSSIVPNAAGDRFFEPSPGRNFYVKLDLNL
jgi:iron complex outermembrane recepter protein